MLDELVNHLEHIHSTLKLSQDKLDKLEFEMEQYSEQYTPSREQTTNYLFKRGIIREHIAYLKGIEDTINGLQEKIRINSNTFKGND